MKPIEFKDQTCVIAENQDEYQNLPALVIPDNGFNTVISCWELSPEELEKVKETGKIWVSVMAFGALQPMILSSDPNELYEMKEVRNGTDV